MAPEDPPVFSEPVLLVQKKTKSVGSAPILDRHGRPIAAVQRGDHPATRVTGVDGKVLLDVTAPPATVTDGSGAEVGRIVPELVFGRARFALRSGERRCGSVHAGDLRGWNFAVLDEEGTEVARITRSWEGLDDVFDRDSLDHVLEFRRPLPQTLRELVVAAVLTVHT